MRVFVIDGTENALYLNTARKYVPDSSIEWDASLDRAIAKLNRHSFDLVILSNGAGKSNLYDVVDTINASRTNNRAEVIILADNPTQATRLRGMLRGRRVYNLKSNQLEKLDDLLERMSA